MTATETVTVKLVIDGGGALRTLDDFDVGMTEAANASVKAGAAVDALTKHIARMRQAQESGIPVMKARTTQMDIEQKMLNSVLGRTDALARARINAERDISRAVASTSNLVIQGKMAEADALRVVTRVEQSHVAQINRMIAAQRQAATSIQATSASVRNSAEAIQNFNLSASRNAFETSNIAMQFQDIAVSAQMGMSPMMVALQQGTQLSAIFNQMKNPLQALPAAFMSIVNPVSLLTIGFVALSTVGIQWVMSLMDGAKDAETVLEDHDDLLDDLLKGYERLRDGAQDALDIMLRLPEAVIAADIKTSLEEQERLAASAAASYESFREKVTKLHADLSELRNMSAGFGEDTSGADTYLAQVEALAQLKFNAESTIPELEGVMIAAKELFRTTDDEAVKSLADDVYLAAAEMHTLQAIAKNLATTLRNLPRDIQIKISMSQHFGDAMGDLKGLYQDPRSRFDQLREQAKIAAEQASMAAATYGQAAAAGAEYERVLASINAAEAEANAKKSGSNRKTDLEKQRDAYAEIVQKANEFIEAQKLEAAVLGMTEEAANALRYEQDLLNQATRDGLAITPELRQHFSMLAQQMASAEAETTRLTKAFDDQKKQIDDVLGTIADAFGKLFDGTIKDFDSFIDHILGGFAKLGQNNLSKMFTSDGLDKLFGADGLNIGDLVRDGAKEGTQAGAAGGILSALKGQGGVISAGLGGLGMGYQSANPLMGGLGGALQGFMATGGNPLGAVIGGIAGVVGGLFGMNQELEKAKQKLNEARPALEKMMAAMNGEKLSSYASAFADYEKQVIEARALAWAAGDGDYARKLQDSFERLQGTMGKALNEEIDRNILALSGMEYVNQAADALDQFNMRMKDAAFLLTDAPRAGEELVLTLQKIVEESELSATQIADLAVRFPELADALSKVKPYVDALIGGLSPERLYAMVQDANRAVDSARSELRSAYDQEARSINEVINRTRAYISSLQQFRDGLRLDNSLSPLSQWERFQEAQRKFADVSQRALGGDADAMDQLEGISRDYLAGLPPEKWSSLK